MNEQRFETLINSIWHFLHDFYHRNVSMSPVDFVVFANHTSPRILIEEQLESDEAFIAIEFPNNLQRQIVRDTNLKPDNLSVVCEEISHFFHITDAAENNYSISILELETLAEIDRFLCFMHWNDFFPSQRISQNHENCLDLCDTLFQNRKFRSENEALYIDAESRAFHHIRRAFSHCWTKRWIDTSQFDPLARNYFLKRIAQRRGSRWSNIETLSA